MKSYIWLAVGLGGLLVAATPTLAQSTTPDSKPIERTASQQQPGGASATNSFDASTGAMKQHTQGLPAGTVPPQYGTDWSRKQQQPMKSQ